MAMQWIEISPSFPEMLTKGNLSYLTWDKWWTTMNNSPDHLTPEAKKKSNAKKPQKWNGIPCHMKEHHCNDFIIKIGGGVGRWGVGIEG